MTSMPVRGCGSCTACCTIKDLAGSPKLIACQHLCHDGCRIYDSRPRDCQTFACLWLSLAEGNTLNRPDQLGIMLELGETDLGLAIIATEIWSGARNDVKANAYALSQAERYGVFIRWVTPSGTIDFFPPWMKQTKQEKKDTLEQDLKRLLEKKESLMRKKKGEKHRF